MNIKSNETRNQTQEKLASYYRQKLLILEFTIVLILTRPHLVHYAIANLSNSKLRKNFYCK